MTATEADDGAGSATMPGGRVDAETSGESGVEADRAEGRSDAHPVLEVRDLRKEFDGVVALDGADLDVRAAEIVGLIGPNGAGKTTLFNCVLGRIAPTAGRVLLNGSDITDLPTPQRVQRGLSRTFQIPRTFPELTVRENMIANQAHGDEGILSTAVTPTDDATEARIDELLGIVDLDGMADEPAGDLSTGQQKLLNLATTLLRDPAVILLDEPTAGVNPALIDEITALVHSLNDQGRTFFVIEHNMDVVRELTDYVYVLANGTNLTDGPPTAALTDDRVLEAYFGE